MDNTAFIIKGFVFVALASLVVALLALNSLNQKVGELDAQIGQIIQKHLE